MLRSDRLRTPDADEHDESDLWERLRSEANQRHSVIDAVARPATEYDDFSAAFDSELPEDFLLDDDLPPSPYDSAEHVRATHQPQRRSYVHAPPTEETEADRLARYEALHAQLGELEYDEFADDAEPLDDAHPEYVEASGFAEQDELDEQDEQDEQDEADDLEQHAPRLSQPPERPRLSQPPLFTPPLRTSRPPSLSSGHYDATQPPAAFGHVPTSKKRVARWVKPLASLVGALALGTAGYQFVLVPHREEARAAELTEQQQQQTELAARREQEETEAAARAEKEQQDANEAALRRADEAAAAAAAASQPPVAKRGASASETRAEAAARKHREHHEQRVAARAAAKEARAAAKASHAAAKAERAKARAEAHAARAEAHAARAEARAARHASHPHSKKVRSSALNRSEDPLYGI